MLRRHDRSYAGEQVARVRFPELRRSFKQRQELNLRPSRQAGTLYEVTLIFTTDENEICRGTINSGKSPEGRRLTGEVT
jgi:hypothetical protein